MVSPLKWTSGTMFALDYLNIKILQAKMDVFEIFHCGNYQIKNMWCSRVLIKRWQGLKNWLLWGLSYLLLGENGWIEEVKASSCPQHLIRTFTSYLSMVVKSSQLPAKIATYLVRIGRLLWLTFLHGWCFLTKISLDWLLTLTNQSFTSVIKAFW